MIRAHATELSQPSEAREDVEWAPRASFVRGYVIFKCLAALSAVHLLDDLASGNVLFPEKAARAKGLNAGTLEAIARYLYGVRVLNKTAAGGYQASASLPELECASIEMLRAYDPMFNGLVELLSNAISYGPALARADELDARATARICRCTAYSAVIDQALSRGARYVLDLGCGAAELLIELCRRHREVRGYGIDISPMTVRYARRRVRQERLANRVDIAVRDIFDLNRGTGLPNVDAGQIDLVLATSVFHEFAYSGVQRLVAALCTVRAVFPGVPVILYEAMEQADDVLRANGSPALEHHLFHRLSLQGIASDASWVPAFGRAGYRLHQRIDVEPGGRLFVLEDGVGPNPLTEKAR